MAKKKESVPKTVYAAIRDGKIVTGDELYTSLNHLLAEDIQEGERVGIYELKSIGAIKLQLV